MPRLAGKLETVRGVLEQPALTRRITEPKVALVCCRAIQGSWKDIRRIS
jgi:hypothetical protein